VLPVQDLVMQHYSGLLVVEVVVLMVLQQLVVLVVDQELPTRKMLLH
tara:strand:+ start:1293 stop:1433 length:141 start_codon:yes stop_codon:yes gene_type:complete